MADTNFETNWDYQKRHIDDNIKPGSFISASKCIIYAAPTLTAERTDFKRIGVIQGYNWGEQRQIEMIFELGSDRPYLVPGRATGQISLARLFVFGKDLVNLLHYGPGTGSNVTPSNEGKTAIASLKEIDKPINLMFAAYSSEEGNPLRYSRVFSTCWIQSRNESISAGQVLIAENVNIMYEEIVSLTTE